jgi:hypothetical protein
MTKHPKRPRDPAQLAKLIVDIATGEVKEILANESAAAKLGRSGGLKGGKARAAKLTDAERTAAAKRAAAARWKNR